ncbi:GNAT family N-acetyltransferase [Paenibacillus oenotherae]|nr:GNAT family N-acetyltransferase [Paenibacillus oenotherae]
MEIIRASREDAEQLLALQKLCFRNEAERLNNFDIPPMLQTLPEIIEEFNSHFFLKSVEDGAIIGSVRAYEADGNCYIGKLIVHPESQNKGIGAALMKQIEQAFSHVKRYELFTGADSGKTIHLYNKLGYRSYSIKQINDQLSFVYMEKLNKS